MSFKTTNIMKEKKVIAFKNQRRRIPLWPTVMTLLVCDRFNAAEWVWGAIGFFLVLIWIGYFWEVATIKEIEVDLFAKDEDNRVK